MTFAGGAHNTTAGLQQLVFGFRPEDGPVMSPVGPFGWYG